MEGPIQIKDSTSTTTTTTTIEPIKSEEIVQGSDSSERSDGAASPPPNCSICLGKLVNTSFTDSCLHQFCFTCLLQWSKIKTECPLCKQTFKSIIHNVRSEEDYDQYHVPRELASQLPQPQVMAALDINFEVDRHWDLHRFFYRTTMTDGRRRRALQNPEQVQRRDQLPNNVPQPSRDEHRVRRPNFAEYRHAVYRDGTWATPLPDFHGRFHDCSADYYRRHPRELDRLIPWLNRDLQVLISNMPAYIPYVLRTIMDALTQHDIRSPQFRNIVRQYCGVHTEHFIHELLNFARTNFDLPEYDLAVTYIFQGPSREYVSHVVSPVPSSSSISSDDSDVRVVEEAIDLRMNTELPGVGPHPINMPGPSTVGQAFRMETPYNVPDVLTISSASSDDECEVIGYVKPRHERTPEIIELISSDPEDINISHTANDNIESSRVSHSRDEPQPGTSQTSKKGSAKKIISETLRTKLSETSSSEDSDFDSDYNPRRSKQRRSRIKKKSSKRSVSDKKRKCSNTRSRKRVERSASSSGESDTRRRSNRRSSRITKTKACSSSDSNLDAKRKRKVSETKPKKEQDISKEMTRTHKDFIKREDRYIQSDNMFTSSSSNSSGSETSNEHKIYKARTQERTKRNYSANSRDYETEKNERLIRNREKSLIDNCIKKDNKFKDSKQSSFRSSSESSYISPRNRRSSYNKRQLQKNKNDYENQDECNSRNIASWKRERSSKTRSDESDSEFRNTSRSSSYSSDYSNRSYSHRRRSKRRSISKDKKRKRLSSTSSNSGESVSSAPNSTTSSSTKSDVYLTLKRSDSKSSSSSKERRRSHKNHKKSKYRKSQSKSKPKKKKRYIRSSSSSNSE